MAWPNSLSTIDSNLSTTELWVLKEKMSVEGGYTVTALGLIMEQGQFIVTLPTGERYKFSEWYELIEEVKQIDEDGNELVKETF